MPALNVLFVEDSENDAALELRQLARAGFTVVDRRVETEAQLRAALESPQPWDVIIADYRLPGYNASAALELLKSTGRDIPFLVVSGAIGEETAVELMRAGACDYLMKDRLTRLAPAVERAIAEAQARRARMRADEALRESERHLRISERIAKVGHWVLYPKTNETYWSEELYRILGYDPAQFHENLTLAWKKSIHPNDARQVLAALASHMGANAVGTLEYRIIRPDGTLRHVRTITGEQVFDENGQVERYTGVLQDITEQKEAELALLEKMQEIETRAHALERITSVSAGMRRAQTRSDLVAVVLDNLLALLNAQFATLAFQEGNYLTFEHAAGCRAWKKQRILLHTRLIGEVMVTKTPMPVRYQDEELRAALPDWVREQLSPCGTLVIYPLLSGRSAVGVILVDLGRPGQLFIEQANLIAAVAEMAGNAITRMLSAEELERMVARREKELDTIYQVTSAASKTLDMRLALEQALSLTLDAVGAEMGGIFLLREGTAPEKIACRWRPLDDENGVEGVQQEFVQRLIARVVEKKQPVLLPEPDPDCLEDEGARRSRSCAGLPMHIQGRLVGVMGLCKPRDERFTVEEISLLSFIADHLGLLIENTSLFKRAERAAVLEERSRLARELHDSVTQLLYSANLYAVGAERYSAMGKYADVSAYLSEIGQLTQQALKDMRLLVYELRAAALEKDSLAHALEQRLDAVERRSSVRVRFDAEGVSLLPGDVEDNLYRIAIEALNNSLKHSHAANLSIALAHLGDEVILTVEDDGCGFDPVLAQRQGGMGMSTMRERAAKLGGTLSVRAAPGAGARIEVRVPVAQTQPAWREGA